MGPLEQAVRERPSRSEGVHPAGYFSLVRTELFQFIPDGRNVILEVGCGDGSTLAELKRIGKAKRIVGIEIDAAAARRAKRVLDAIYQGDVERDRFPLRRGQFDFILFPDILEHLVDPWSVLKKMRAYLKPGGQIIVSVPNVRHFSVLRDLVLRDDWAYSEAGIMDRTHLRFFTRKTILAAITQAGYKVERLETNGGDLRGWKHWLDQASGGRIAPWFVAQHLILAGVRPQPSSRRSTKR